MSARLTARERALAAVLAAQLLAAAAVLWTGAARGPLPAVAAPTAAAVAPAPDGRAEVQALLRAGRARAAEREARVASPPAPSRRAAATSPVPAAPGPAEPVPVRTALPREPTGVGSSPSRADPEQPASAAATGQSPPRTADPAPPAQTSADERVDYESRLLAAVNAERRERGLRALTADACADRAADAQAQRMAEREQLGHQDLSAVLSRCGATKAAENVGSGAVTPERMVALWMASDAHRRTVLDPELTSVGTGAVRGDDGRWWASQVFLRR